MTPKERMEILAWAWAISGGGPAALSASEQVIQWIDGSATRLLAVQVAMRSSSGTRVRNMLPMAEELAKYAEEESSEETPVKKRGRPPGSKNKPTDDSRPAETSPPPM